MAHTPPGETREKIYRFVRERLEAGAPPTIREVQRAFGFRSVESARSQLEALVREGRLVKQPGRARGYRLPPGRAPRPARLVPLVGRVPAGALAAAIEDPEGYLPVAAPSSGGRELFALRVRGDSMVGAGILPGDILIVRRQPSADPGDIVVAAVEGIADEEATVKRLRLRRGRWVLCPENPAYEPIVPPPGALRILGRVVEVRRYLEAPPLVERPGGEG
ncbi:MAG: repressor LexA [Acidobacteria bacterium]|nr:MAG: repressor LexA [Acidobacteriota bacterium]